MKQKKINPVLGRFKKLNKSNFANLLNLSIFQS